MEKLGKCLFYLVGAAMVITTIGSAALNIKIKHDMMVDADKHKKCKK